MKKIMLLAASIVFGVAVSLDAAEPYDQANQSSFGDTTYGMTLNLSGVLQPHVSGNVSLGDSTYKIGNINMSGTLTSAGDVVITGDITVSGEATINVVAVADISVTTPTAVGQLMFDTASTDLYIGTETLTTTSWQKVGSQD